MWIPRAGGVKVEQEGRGAMGCERLESGAQAAEDWTFDPHAREREACQTHGSIVPWHARR